MRVVAMKPFRFNIGVNTKQRNPEERFTLLHTLGGYQPVSVSASRPRPKIDERPPACKLCVCLLFLVMCLPVAVAVYLTTRSSEHSASSEREAAFAARGARSRLAR